MSTCTIKVFKNLIRPCDLQLILTAENRWVTHNKTEVLPEVFIPVRTNVGETFKSIIP